MESSVYNNIFLASDAILSWMIFSADFCTKALHILLRCTEVMLSIFAYSLTDLMFLGSLLSSFWNALKWTRLLSLEDMLIWLLTKCFRWI